LDIGVRAGGQYAVLFGDEPGPGGDPREMVIRGSKAEGIEGWLEAIGAADAGFLSVVADITSAADAGASVVESLVGMAGGNLYSIVVIPGESRDPATHYFSSAALSKLLRASRLSVAVDEVLADDFRAAVLDRGRRVDRGHLLETLRGALLALRGAHADWLEYPPGSRRILIPSVLYNSDREVFGRAAIRARSSTSSRSGGPGARRSFSRRCSRDSSNRGPTRSISGQSRARTSRTRSSSSSRSARCHAGIGICSMNPPSSPR
jgi:hypothetical protein